MPKLTRNLITLNVIGSFETMAVATEGTKFAVSSGLRKISSNPGLCDGLAEHFRLLRRDRPVFLIAVYTFAHGEDGDILQEWFAPEFPARFARPEKWRSRPQGTHCY